MKVYEDAASCPQITEEQRAAILKRVRNGILPWSDRLMQRANISPEECITPQVKFPFHVIRDLLEKGYTVPVMISYTRYKPSEIYWMKYFDFAIKHNIPRDEVLEFLKYDKEFKEKMEEINEGILNGDIKQVPEVTVEDLKPLFDL